MKKEFLPIGTVVRVYKTAYAFYTNKNERVIGLNRLKNPVIGVIVGATHIVEGSYHEEKNPSYFEGEYYPPYLIEDKRHFVYLVRQGLLNKPLKVLPKDISSVVSLAFTSHIPFLYQKKYPFSEVDRELLRAIMKDIPRDSKGRWMKC